MLEFRYLQRLNGTLRSHCINLGATGFRCDHSRAPELFTGSIMKNQSCYAPVKCTGFKDDGMSLGDEVLTGCVTVTSERPQMGYWYDGTSRGMYGLTTMSKMPFCYRCTDDLDCSAGEACQDKDNGETEHSCGKIMMCPGKKRRKRSDCTSKDFIKEFW